MDALEIRSITEALQKAAGALSNIAVLIDNVPNRTEFTYLVSTTPPSEGRDILYRIDNDTGDVYVYNWREHEWEG